MEANRPKCPRVLVTRSPRQGSALADALRALGAEPVLVPAIETVPPASWAALDTAWAELGRFDWATFTSANAVEAIAPRVHGLPASQAHKAWPRIAAIGPATARALEGIGLQPTLIPPEAVAESLLAALLPYARRPNGEPARFLLLRAEQGRELLPEALRAAGAEVTIAPVYRTVIPEGSVDALRALFAPGSLEQGTGDLDAATFTSSSTARNLQALCEAAGVSLPPSALRVSIGPITSQTLRELGLAPHAEAPEATVAALARTVVEALARRNSSL